VPVLDRYLPQPGRPFNISNLLDLDHKTPVRLCVFDHSGSEAPTQRNGAFIVASAAQKLASEVGSPLLERARHPAGAPSQYAILSYCLFAVGEGSRV
jgi:hypothetical protein